MENDTANKSIPELLTSGEDAASAAETHGAAIGILQHTGLKIRAEVAALVLAIDTVENTKTELSARRVLLQQSISDCRGLLTVGRDLFKQTLGSTYNEKWDALGLVDSLEIPRVAEELQPVMRSFKAYLTAHPEREVDPVDVTAGKYDELFQGLHAARISFREQEVALDQARQVRDEKAEILRHRLRALIDELASLLGPLDVRWKWFGFNMPGAQATPDVPQHVVVTLINATSAAVKWNAAPRAEYYHVWKRVVGVDEELVLIESRDELDFTFESLPANATIELAVSAVNNGGESQKSEVVRIVTH